MRRKWKSMLSLLIIWAMILTSFSGSLGVVYAEEEEKEAVTSEEVSADQDMEINPMIEGTEAEEIVIQELQEIEAKHYDGPDESEYLKDISEAAAVLRAGMVKHEEKIHFKYLIEGSYDSNISRYIMEEAVQETGNPIEGDYLKWTRGGWYSNTSYSPAGDKVYCDIEYVISYYTTMEQENELTNAVNSLINGFGFTSSTSEYEKIKTIYDYICSNITYDDEHLKDNSYMLKQTAYAALINKTAVCQGYAVLLYRLLHEVGIDSRVLIGATGSVNGDGHAWNLAKIGEKYYYLDSTWDAKEEEYAYFLHGSSGLAKHFLNDEYNSEEFHQRYPIADTDYIPSTKEPEDDTKATGVNVAYHTEQEVRDYIKNHKVQLNGTVTYKEEPVTTEPYSAGVLSDETLQSALNTLNSVRYIAGLSDNVTLDDSYSQRVQAGTLVNSVNNKMTHYPEQPSGMSDELFQLGRSGTSSSNLGSGYSNLNTAIISGWMNDGDNGNIDRIGHRRWVLNSTMGKTGFGYVGKQSGMYAFDSSNTSAKEKGVIWPAQETPLEYFGKVYPWSYSYGEVLDKSKISVKLVRDKDKKEWNFSEASADGYFNVENSGYGEPGCVIFRPNDITGYTSDDRYHVTIYNGSAVMADYGVHFFAMYPIQSFTLANANMSYPHSSIGKDGTQLWPINISPEGADSDYEWKSSDESVAKIEYEYGTSIVRVKLVGCGETVITATALTGGATATATVKVAHDPGAQATCTTPQTCKSCGKVIKEALGHQVSSKYSHDDKNHWKVCTRDGVKFDEEAHHGGTATEKEKAICEVCGTAYGDVLPHTHKWETSARTIKEATCTAEGQKAIYCSECGAVKEGSRTVIPKKEHTWDRGKVTKEATCTGKGTKVYTCSQCKTTRTEEIPMLDHKWETTPRVDKEATEKEEGSKSIHCSVCDTVKEGSREVIPRRDHEWDAGKVTKEATCTEKGIRTYTCSDCGTTRTEEIPKLDHKWEQTARIDKKATCTAEGLKSIHCSVCDIVKEGTQEVVPKKEHIWDEGKVTKKPTKSSEGVRTYTCSVCKNTRTEAIPKLSETAKVTYRTHVQSIGWQEWKTNGEMSGTSGLGKRLEGINIKLKDAEFEGGITYRTHVQSYGWQKWKSDGEMSGTSGEAKRLEAIQIKLTGEMAEHYDVYYCVHAQSYGWLNWAKNGESAGTSGYGKRLEAIQIMLVEKGGAAPEKMPSSKKTPYVHPLVQYRTHVQSFGWQGWKFDGDSSGTSGLGKRLEGINIELKEPDYEGGISYQTHAQTYGWQGWVSDGEMAGTSGEGKRLEAIQIALTGEMAEHYDVYYRVHAQTYGWLDWAKNGEEAGTSGLAKRLEAIQIVLVEKGKAAPGSTARPYVKKTAANTGSGSGAQSGTKPLGTVYWVTSGKVYHSTLDCPTLSRSHNIQSGSIPNGRTPCKVCIH